MKATLPWFAALLLAVAACTAAQAGPYPYYYPSYPQAPDACGPGFYCTNCCGAVYGPNYCVRPPYPPFNGFRPSLSDQNQGGTPGYPVHPFARSPRDFFMVD
jgi:hypothetical protein